MSYTINHPMSDDKIEAITAAIRYSDTKRPLSKRELSIYLEMKRRAYRDVRKEFIALLGDYPTS